MRYERIVVRNCRSDSKTGTLSSFLPFFCAPFGCSTGEEGETEVTFGEIVEIVVVVVVTDSKGRNSCAVNPIPLVPFTLDSLFTFTTLCIYYWTNSFRRLIHTLSLHPAGFSCEAFIQIFLPVVSPATTIPTIVPPFRFLL